MARAPINVRLLIATSTRVDAGVAIGGHEELGEVVGFKYLLDLTGLVPVLSSHTAINKLWSGEVYMSPCNTHICLPQMSVTLLKLLLMNNCVNVICI